MTTPVLYNGSKFSLKWQL